MHKKQVNPVAIRTQKSISNSFLSLLEKYDYEKITVTDICKDADIVRKTFYNNFQSKDHLVESLIHEVFVKIESSLDLYKMSINELLLFAFQFVMDNRESLLLFYNRGLLRFAYKTIASYINSDHILTKLNQENLDSRAYKYISAQVSAVLISVIETWIENDFNESIEFLADLTESMMYKPLSIDND